MPHKVLSYCLFKPKILPQHRLHDKWMNEPLRYWFNLPAVVMTNKILYPDYKMLLYVSENVWEEELSGVLNALQDLDNLVIDTIKMDYAGTEPAIWRMMPLWDQEVEVLHTRDIDSLPSEIEYRYGRVFEKSNCSLGTLRMHPNHYGIKCRMLAGVSSFKPQEIPPQLKLNNFQTYFSFRHNDYGSDQDLMIHRFTVHPSYTKDKFLDHCDFEQHNPQDFPCVRVESSQLENVSISESQQKLFDCLKENNLNNWSGDPVDARGAYTNFLFQQDEFKEIQDKICEHNLLKEFYFQ